MRISTGPKIHVRRTLSMILFNVLKRALWQNQDADLTGIGLIWRTYPSVAMCQ